MELQLLLILAVAFLVFGPEKMLEFATQLGRLVRKIKQEWASIQLEAEMNRLKEQLTKQTLEGEGKVKAYLSGEVKEKPKTQKEIMKEFLSEEDSKKEPLEEKKEKLPTLEDLTQGKAPIVEPPKN